MKLIQYKFILQLAFILTIGMSCTESGSSQDTGTEPMETESGIKYQFVHHGTGEVPPEGGYWTMNLAYFNDKGEVIFSSADQGGAMPMNYSATRFGKNASIEECFALIGKGDSSVFYLSADSLYKNTAGGPTPPDLVGTKIKLSIGIEKIFSAEEFGEYTKELEKEQLEKEKDGINTYVSTKGLNVEVTEEGLYYEITKVGNGEMPQVGQTVRVNYTGFLMDGTVFDTSIEEAAKEANVYSPGRQYQPYTFPLGQGNVIRGWDIGIGLLSVGGKATIVVPSSLAYGNRGSGQVIKPNSTLVFNVELVEIVK
jgi:FKBP-type peptidyl-prolyl cis-trans isomerase FkpA